MGCQVNEGRVIWISLALAGAMAARRMARSL